MFETPISSDGGHPVEPVFPLYTIRKPLMFSFKS